MLWLKPSADLINIKYTPISGSSVLGLWQCLFIQWELGGFKLPEPLDAHASREGKWLSFP